MRISAPLLTVVGTVAGVAAAVVTYQSVAAAGSPAPEPASSTTTQGPAAPSVNWLPCEHGWKVKGNTCVRVKQKVVVVHDLPAPAAPQASVATARSHSSTGRDDSESSEPAENETGDNESEDQSEDVGDDSQDSPDSEDVSNGD